MLIVKTQAGYRHEMEKLISQHINYTNFIAEISPTNINDKFIAWLNAEVAIRYSD